jgi:hypothetical protein
MPYQKNGKRDYKTENEKYNSRPEQRAARSARSVARVQSNTAGRTSKGDGKDLDHIKPISKGGKTTPSNLRVVPASKNRSFPRKANGAMK